MNKITLIPLLLAAAVFASATDSVLTEQRALLQNLQDMDVSKPGVLITGEFKSDANSVMLDSSGSRKTTEINAATQANIRIEARPTAETRATVRFRIHQDWHKSREEGISPFLFHWISYDGRAFENRIDFNLGDMRIAYTPLTIFLPGLGLDNEPEIFEKRRKDAMEYSNLDGSNGRLLQGLNFSMHSGNVAFLDDAYLQVTGSRLRAQAKKYDQLALDIDDTDRFLIAGRGGVDLYGVSLSGAYIYTFSREKAAENFITSAVTGLGDLPYLLEDNGVASATLGLNVAKFAGLNGWKLNVSGEYADSWYQTWWFDQDRNVKEQRMVTNISSIYVNGEKQDVTTITYETVAKRGAYTKTNNGSLNDNAIHAVLEVSPPTGLANLAFNFRWVQNGKNFISELAQSPEYFAASILNASALNHFQGSTLENLYFAVYSNEALTQLSLLGQRYTGYETATLTGVGNLYNNYRNAHFVRTGFTGNSLTPAEMFISPAALDPGVNLSMPWGLATPDRFGFLLNLEWALLDNKLSLNAKANWLAQDEAFEPNGKAPSYLDFGGGFSVEAGRFMGLQKPLTLQAGFEKSTESDGYERTSQNIMAGLRWGIWRSISLVGGFAMVEKDYGTALPLKATEMLLLAGPEIKLSEGAYFNAQYGMLNNEYKSTENTKLNRNIITADVRVKF
jgi:hypothetical protein